MRIVIYDLSDSIGDMIDRIVFDLDPTSKDAEIVSGDVANPTIVRVETKHARDVVIACCKKWGFRYETKGVIR